MTNVLLEGGEMITFASNAKIFLVILLSKRENVESDVETASLMKKVSTLAMTGISSQETGATNSVS